jgi:small subunit ribosomal protein S6
VSDEAVPKITEGLRKSIEDLGGTEVIEINLGKKKLAYPIKRTRNGYYVVVNFTIDPNKINELDAKIRTQENSIIRYLLINTEQHLARVEKDKVEQAKLVRRVPAEAVSLKKDKTGPPLIEINQEELDKKIEEALSEDLTK